MQQCYSKVAEAFNHTKMQVHFDRLLNNHIITLVMLIIELTPNLV